MTSLRLSLVALTFALWSAAVPAHSAVFAQFDPDASAADFKWVRSTSPSTGGDLFSINSTGATSAQGVATHFTFLDPALSALAFLPATLTLSASAPSGNPAVNNGGGIYTQLGVSGGFSFIYSGVSGIVGGHVLVQNVTNLLSGVFTNAWMQGGGTSGSANLAATSGSASYTSDIELFTGAKPNSDEFAFNLLDVTPGFGATVGKALNSFRANGGGNFSFLATPEPAAWGLMLVGFAGLGLAMRARRRTAAA